MKLLKILWALPNTLLVLPLIMLSAVSRGGRVRLLDGVIEVHGGIVAWLLQHATLLKGGAMAITFGHAVLGRDAESLDVSREHERVHVRQYERWGPFFIPAYLLSSLWLWRRGRDPYLENPFEVEAYGTEGNEPGR